MATEHRRKPPVGALLASGCGTILLGLGAMGLIASPPIQFAPALADRTTALALIVAGLVIEIGAVLAILQQQKSIK
jgi:hypothetical protein